MGKRIPISASSDYTRVFGADEFGPEYVIRVWDPRIQMLGFLVIDNTALGPGKGGIRMSASVTEEEVRRLARTMTWKNALAGIPFGGAKAGILLPPGFKNTPSEKRAFIECFARALKSFLIKKYIAGPDVNTGENEMKWFAEAAGEWNAATGKPANYCVRVNRTVGDKCGIPHEFGSTGFGVAHATKVALHYVKIRFKGATVAIHGFGNVGTFAYQFLTDMGAKVVALADRSGAVYSHEGFPRPEVEKVITARLRLAKAFKRFVIPIEAFWGLKVDVLIPASVTDVIDDSNKRRVRAKVIVEAGNIPMRERIEEELHKKGILIVPDFVANAGGVISSYAEYKGYHPKKMFDLVEKKIASATRAVLDRSMMRKRNPREVAVEIAAEKVREAMAQRRNAFLMEK